MARDKDDLWRNFPKTAIEFERRVAAQRRLGLRLLQDGVELAAQLRAALVR